MSDESYNGYTNVATYFVCSTFDNVETPFHKLRGLASEEGTEDEVREYVEAQFFGTPDPDLHPSELETMRQCRKYISEAELDEVDWKEVREHFTD